LEGVALLGDRKERIEAMGKWSKTFKGTDKVRVPGLGAFYAISCCGWCGGWD